MSAQSKGLCIVCGQPAAEAHHCMGSSNVPEVTAPTCKPDHLDLNADLRRAGVPLSHARTPTHAEITYATLVGETSVLAAVATRFGSDLDEQVEIAASMRNALTRHLIAAQPVEQRTFGPEPLAQAGRTWRPHPAGGSLPVPDSPVCLAGMFSLLGDSAEALLGPTGRWDEYVSAVSATGQGAAVALRRLGELDQERDHQLGLIARRALVEMTALAAALDEADPYEPSEEQVAALGASVSTLAEFEWQWLFLLGAVGSADTDEEALAVLDSFLATHGEP